MKNKKEYVSKCCGASLEVGRTPDFIGDDKVATHYYICSKCKKPCDVIFKKIKMKTNFWYLSIILVLAIAFLWIVYPMQRMDINSYSPTIKYEIVEATCTAYNTVKAQCDGNECVSASGAWICGRDDVVACPVRYPFGTKVVIAGKDYVCLDRLARRYWDENRFDISFDKDIDGAIQHGIKKLKVKVYD